MSFILDALKKSEADRQRQSTPGIADVAEGSGKRSPSRWIWVVVALLSINLLVLAFVLLRPGPTPAASQPAVRQAPAVTTPTARLPAAESGEVTEDPQASFSDIVTEAKQRRPEPAPAPPPEPEVAVAAAVERTTVNMAPRTNKPSTLTESYPTFNEVRANGSVQLSDLHIDIHVYHEQQSKRFVFINMSKYTEHKALSEGPVVREIVPEGVILEYRGTEFLLPRQ